MTWMGHLCQLLLPLGKRLGLLFLFLNNGCEWCAGYKATTGEPNHFPCLPLLRMDLIWMGAPIAVRCRACAEISDRMVESSSWKLKLYVGRVEFLAKEKYPYLKYLKMGMSLVVTPEERNWSSCHHHGLKLTVLHPACIALLTGYWLLQMGCFSPLGPFPLHMGSSTPSGQGEGRREISFLLSLLPSPLWMSARLLLCRTGFKNAL